MSDVWIQLSEVWCHMSDVRRLISDIWYQISDITHPTSHIRRLTSNIYHTSDVCPLSWNVWHQMPGICQMFDVRCLMCDMCDVWSQMSDSTRLKSHVWSQMSDVRRLMLGVWSQTSDVTCLTQATWGMTTSLNMHILVNAIWNGLLPSVLLKSELRTWLNEKNAWNVISNNTWHRFVNDVTKHVFLNGEGSQSL